MNGCHCYWLSCLL